MNESRSSPKILIVDDKLQNLYALEKLLRQLRTEVIQATSGSEALGLALEHDFCLAIVDVQMPEIDGYEFVELLRGNPSTASLPVIFISAIYSGEYHHRKGYDTGAVDFLSKPFVPEILLSKIQVFLDLYHQRVKLQELVNELNTKNEALVQITGELQEANRALSKRAMQLEASNQMGQQVTSILDLVALLEAAVKAIQSRLGYYYVAVGLLNEAKDKVVLQAGIGRDGSRPPAPGSSFDLDGVPSIINWVARSGMAYRADDVHTDDKYLAYDGLPATRSEVALPLQVGEEILGVLDIQSDRLARFDDEDQRVLQTLSNQIAIAVRNARLYELEKKLNVDKDRFFSIISHDLRRPFNYLLGNAYLLYKRLDKLSKEDIQDMSEDVYKGAKAAYDLLDNLLTWSRMQREGGMSYEPEPIEVEVLIRETVELLSQAAAQKEIGLSSDIEAGLIAHGDRQMLCTVLRNLTSNALKFTPRDGTVTLSAQRRTVDASEFAAITVRDTGVGMSEKVIDKLFRIDVNHSTLGTDEEQGTGLGLIICKEMTERNGGQIRVESELGQGTMVEFTVPLAE
jgi:signal transduction histidine kinase/CheY-like chemotaxis protein